MRLSAGRGLAGQRRGREALEQLEVALRLEPDAAARVSGGLSPGHIASVVPLDLQHHGDSASGRIAAQRCADWYGEREERLAARYERYFKARCLMMLGRTDEAGGDRRAARPGRFAGRPLSMVEACWRRIRAPGSS
jgi:hypothetical protein